jgi:hypothetical protein
MTRARLGRAQLPPACGYFPVAGGTFTGESLPGAITWARAYIKGDAL